MALLDVRDLKIAFYDTTPPTEVVKRRQHSPFCSF